MRTIVLASNNQGKLREFNALFADQDREVVPQGQFDVPEVEETGLSFVENAIIKARHAAKLTGLPALADDSGIQVDALNGAPGIYSARYAGPGATDADNCALLLERLQEVPEAQRGARFQCILVYMEHAADPTPRIFQGTWEGRILLQPQGSNGFGYDPVFYVPNFGCSAAELGAETKNAISHRGQALRLLHAAFESV